MNAIANGLKLIKGARVIDGQGGYAPEANAVLVDGKVIRWVGPQKELAVPEGADPTVYDFPNMTILPGLIDVHTHTNLPGDGSPVESTLDESDDMLLLRSAWNTRRHLESGVTTARENGAKNLTALSLRDGINKGFIPGPRMVVSGRPVTITGGHCWPFGGEADGVDGVRQAVRQLVKEGVDFIKVMATGGATLSSFPFRPAYNVEELTAVVDEAHNFGKLVGAHCTSVQGIINSLDAGVDMVIHGVFHEPDGSYNYRPDVAERIATAGAWVNPTLLVGRIIVQGFEDRKREFGLTAAESDALEHTKRRSDDCLDTCRRLNDLGVKMASGSDAAWGNYPMGQFQRELEVMAEIGMTNMQTILSGTSQAAVSIGMQDIVGALEPGKEADILVVDGDPGSDLRALSKVAAVFKEGVRYR